MRLYGTVSRGYKAGGYTVDYDANSPDMGIVRERFDEETLWNYEIGLRSEWFDRRLRLNISGFYLEWSDLQLEHSSLLCRAMLLLMLRRLSTWVRLKLKALNSNWRRLRRNASWSTAGLGILILK